MTHFRYISERVTNLPNFSFPLGSESLGAVLKANSSLISSGTSDTLHFSEQIAEVGFFFALSLLIYFSYHFIEQKERKSFKYAKSLLNLSSFNLSMTIMLYMSFLGSIVAIMLFKPSPRVLPFKNFEDMADALVEGKIRLVAMDSATGFFSSISFLIKFSQSLFLLTQFLVLQRILLHNTTTVIPEIH